MKWCEHIRRLAGSWIFFYDPEEKDAWIDADYFKFKCCPICETKKPKEKS